MSWLAGTTGPAGFWRPSLKLLFPEHGRLGLNGLPIEEIVKAGPGVDLGIANATVEVPGTLVRVLLPGRGVIHPAAGAGELFGCPYAIGHGA